MSIAKRFGVTGAGKQNVIQNNAITADTEAAIDCDPARITLQDNTVWKE